MINIEEIRELNQPSNIIISGHALTRMEEKSISVDDVCKGIETGRIIEQYPEDFPLPSCLVLGFDCGGKTIHLVLALTTKKIRLITVYYPDTERWLPGFETRRK